MGLNTDISTVFTVKALCDNVFIVSLRVLISIKFYANIFLFEILHKKLRLNSSILT